MKTLLPISLFLCLITTTAFSQINLSAGLVGHWKFCGDANDETIYNNNGQVYGATLTEDRFGNPNEAYQFDGINDYIDISCGPEQSFSTYEEFTVSCWAKMPASQVDLGANGNVLISKWHYPNSDNVPYGYPYTIRVYNDNAPTPYDALGARYHRNYGQSANQWTCVKSNAPVNDEKFHLLLIKRMNDSIYFFLDAVQTDVVLDLNPYSTSNGAPLRFGKMANFSTWADCHFTGVLDDVRIYNRALNNGEILALYDEAATCNSTSTQNTLTKEAIEVYPNPAINHLNIEVNNQQNIDMVAIIDLHGRYLMYFDENISSLDISTLPAGLYFLEVRSQDEIIIKKFVKQ